MMIKMFDQHFPEGKMLGTFLRKSKQKFNKFFCIQVNDPQFNQFYNQITIS